MERRKSAGKVSGVRKEGGNSRLTVNPRPKYRGRVGCNRAVKLSQMVKNGGNKDAGRGGGGGGDTENG